MIISGQARGSGIARCRRPEVISIYADSFARMQNFSPLSVYGSLQKIDGKDGTSMVLSPDSSFFRFFKDNEGAE